MLLRDFFFFSPSTWAVCVGASGRTRVRSVFECACRRVGAFPCLRRNSDTEMLRWTVLPVILSSLVAELQKAWGKEVWKGGRKKASEGGRQRGLPTSPSKFKTNIWRQVQETSPERLYMSFWIFSGIKTWGVYCVHCQDEGSNKGWCEIIHETTKVVAEILVCIQFRKRLRKLLICLKY